MRLRRKTKQKTLLLSLILACILVAGLGLYILNLPDQSPITAHAVQKPLEEVKIGIRGHLFYLPAYVAQARGYFVEQGLDAELMKFDSTNQMINALITGKIDAGIGGVNSIVVIDVESKSPNSLKIFSTGIFSEDFEKILVSKDSNIDSVKDLEGKTLATYQGSTAKIFMTKFLNNNNLQTTKLVQLKPSDQLSALASGSVDAIHVIEPLATIGVEKGIATVIDASPIANYFGTAGFPLETSILSVKFISQKPDAARKIVLATDKAAEFISKYPEIARNYYSEFTSVDDSIESLLPLSDYSTSQDSDLGEFQKSIDHLAEVGVIDESMDVHSLFYKP